MQGGGWSELIRFSFMCGGNGFTAAVPYSSPSDRRGVDRADAFEEYIAGMARVIGETHQVAAVHLCLAEHTLQTWRDIQYIALANREILNRKR